MNAIATKTAHQISEVYPPGNASYLKELFSAVIQQLRQIVNAHTVVLDSLRAILDDQQNGHEIPLYSKEEVWGHVQAVVGSQWIYYFRFPSIDNIILKNPWFFFQD